MLMIVSNWQKIMTIQELLADLRAAGLTDRYIAEQMGVNQSLVWRLRNGKNKSTSFERGERLAILHRRVCGRKQRVM